MTILTNILRLFPYVRDLEKRITELKKMSREDRLTGILNAAGIIPIALSQLALFKSQPKRGARGYEHTNLSVVYIDLDNFKRINDTEGHDAADKMLKSFVMFINAHTRESEDVLARWYRGDEFVLMVKNMNHGQVIEKISHIQNLLDQGTLKTPSKKFFLTFSFGVASVFEDGRKENLNFHALRNISDERMMADKLLRKGPMA